TFSSASRGDDNPRRPTAMFAKRTSERPPPSSATTRDTRSACAEEWRGGEHRRRAISESPERRRRVGVRRRNSLPPTRGASAPLQATELARGLEPLTFGLQNRCSTN